MSNETFLVTIKVELDDGTSRESRHRIHENLIHKLKYSNSIEKMYDELLEPNPLIENDK